jgi:hypothetical protein
LYDDLLAFAVVKRTDRRDTNPQGLWPHAHRFDVVRALAAAPPVTAVTLAELSYVCRTQLRCATSLAALFLTEGVNGLWHGFEPFARNMLATDVRQAVGSVVNLLQGTVNAGETRSIANHQISVQLQRCQSLCLVLKFPRCAVAVGVDLGLVKFRRPGSGSETFAHAKQLTALLLNEGRVQFRSASAHDELQW